LMCIDISTASVNCGGHSAPTCLDCPIVDGFDYGSAYCNGDCTWDLTANECVGVDMATASVSCGDHSAPTCQDCPVVNDFDYGQAYCNGECTWDLTANECVPHTRSCGTNGVVATLCSMCPEGICDSEYCTFHARTELCRDAFSDEVRTASVHLRYQVPPSVTKPAWYFQKVVPTALEDATYVMTNGFQYGYGGIQRVNSDRGAIVFSMWDHCDEENDENCPAEEQADLVFCGDGVDCGDFGGEGTGRKSIRYIDGGTFPVVGDEYYFVTQAHLNEERSKMEYTGYFYDNGTWKLMSRLMVGQPPGQNWWFTNMHSFLEQWTNADTTKDRAAMYGPAFVADTDGMSLEQILSGVFTHGTLENHEHVNARFEEAENAITIETGGTVVPEAFDNEIFPYDLNATPGAEFRDFQSKIPCLNQADTASKIKKCLEEENNIECIGEDEEGCRPYITGDMKRQIISSGYMRTYTWFITIYIYILWPN